MDYIKLMGDSEDWTQDIVQDFVDSHNNSMEFLLREINEKESDMLYEYYIDQMYKDFQQSGQIPF
jgi:hypothetical protein|nr:MAG TPA: hypothetical protein [Bacteriophage sp.]